jgi:uncharacterized DUF497 family protein
VGPGDLLDVFLYGDALFYPADRSRGDAEWIMVGQVPGLVLAIPLARSSSGDTSKCRPVSIHQASESERRRYQGDVG